MSPIDCTAPASRFVLRRLATILALALVPSCGNADGPTSSPSRAVPPELVGHWRLTAATSSQTCDPTGHCTGAYGGSESYAFATDGHFEFTQYLESNLGGCRIVATIYAKGTLRVTGSTVTLAPSYAHQSKTANCESSFERDLTIDPTPYTWRVARDQGGRSQLYLTGATGTDGPFDLTT